MFSPSFPFKKAVTASSCVILKSSWAPIANNIRIDLYFTTSAKDNHYLFLPPARNLCHQPSLIFDDLYIYIPLFCVNRFTFDGLLSLWKLLQ